MYDYGRGLWIREHGDEWLFEYMPAAVQVGRGDFFMPANPAAAASHPLAVRVIPLRQAPLEHSFQVSGAAPWRMQLHQFYFPGWETYVDGARQAARPAGPLGLVAADIPAGEHSVAFRFGSTAPRRLGWALSLAGGVLWLAGLLWLRRWRWLIALSVLAVLWSGLAFSSRLASPADYRPSPVGASFGDEVQLAGFYAPDAELRPGKPTTVVLDWLALGAPQADYKVFVHLIDSDGKLWAQHDGQPGFEFSPTTRWQAGEMMEDQHVLEWRGQPPPGRYQLRAGLYDPRSGNRLPVSDKDGQASGDQVLLAEFEIK